MGRRIDRRRLLGATAGLVAAAVAPGPATGQGAPAGEASDPRRPADPGSGESLALARHVAHARFEDVPAEAVRLGRYSLLDALGVSLAASGLEPACRPFLDQAIEEGRGGTAVVLGTGKRSTPGLAALANGSLAHALDYEDAHDPSRTHPNAAAVATAVALATAGRKLDGREMLMAVMIGSDVCCRISMAQGNVDELPKAFYPPAIAGTFGATATAARLLRLTPEQTLDAFSLALCQNSCSAEILSDAYSDIRAVRDGLCAQVGVQAAQLAQRGVKGFSRPIEGERGLYAMVAGGRHVPGRLTADLGRRFEGQFVGFKAWPACRDAHPYVQAVLEGQRRDRLRPDDIVSIRAFVPERSLIICEPRDEKRRPRAAIDAKFSVYFTVASALLRRNVGFANFEPAALRDGATLALADRVDYTVDRGRPRLVVTLRDGGTREWSIASLYGSPENPMGEADLRAKFIDCGQRAARPLRASQLEALADRLLAVERETDVAALLRLL